VSRGTPATRSSLSVHLGKPVTGDAAARSAVF
jgi:hypothetical protein